MDINAEACIKQGEELGMIAKKKSALKYQMHSFANNLICTNPKDANSARTVRLFRNRRYIHSDLVVRVFCSKRYVFPLLL